MCNFWSVGLPTKIEQTFSTPQIYRQLEGPLLETVRNGKTSTFLKVWFLENAKFLKVFNHHKLIQDSQEDFKHLEFSHFLHMRRYRIRWKTLKMQNKNKNKKKKKEKEKEKYFKQIATKVMKFYKGFTLGITWLLMNITSVILKEKLSFIEISARKLRLVRWFQALKFRFWKQKY